MRPARGVDDTSEVAILGRAFEPDKPSLSRAAARSILALAFSEADRVRMRDLAEKAREGTLTAAERAGRRSGDGADREAVSSAPPQVAPTFPLGRAGPGRAYRHRR